jgi:DNA-binding GntR family transcriptional regulator
LSGASRTPVPLSPGSTFDAEEVRQLCTLRIELEALALEWACPRVSAADAAELKALVDRLVEAGERGARREFPERDLTFHKGCWALSGNTCLAETIERLINEPLVCVRGAGQRSSPSRQHYAIVNALEKLQPPEFDQVVRKTLTGFALRWISSMSSGNGDESGEGPNTARSVSADS